MFSYRVNPSRINNKGIYIQHVDGGLYTKENWSNKGYSNDLCNGIALVDKVCFVIATEYIGTFRWGKDGEIDNIFAQDSSHMGTIKKDYWGRENQNAYLEYISIPSTVDNPFLFPEKDISVHGLPAKIRSMCPRSSTFKSLTSPTCIVLGKFNCVCLIANLSISDA